MHQILRHAAGTLWSQRWEIFSWLGIAFAIIATTVIAITVIATAMITIIMITVTVIAVVAVQHESVSTFRIGSRCRQYRRDH